MTEHAQERIDALMRDAHESRVQRVLIVPYGRVGENLIWTSVLGALVREHPDWLIQVLTNRPSLWHGMPGAADIIALPPDLHDQGAPDALDRLVPILREKSIDAAVVYDREPPLVETLRRAGIPHVLDMELIEKTHRRLVPSLYNDESAVDYHICEEFVLWASPLGVGQPPWPMAFPVPESAREDARHILRDLGIPPNARLVVYNVGTHQTARLFGGRVDRVWPIQNFIDCERILLREDFGAPLYFALNRSSLRETFMAWRAKAALPRGRVKLLPRWLDLTILAAVLHEAVCVLTGNTGTMHLAAAVNAPTVAVFNDRWKPSYNGPYLPAERRRVLVATGGGPQPCARISGETAAHAVAELIGT